MIRNALWIFLVCCFHLRHSYACESDPTAPTMVNITVSNGTVFITSPTYPRDYANNELCYWLVTATGGGQVGYKFAADFAMEDSENCKNDYIELMLGNYSSNSRIALSCSNVEPASQLITGSQLFVKFRTDSGTVAKGFKMGIAVDTEPEDVPSEDNTDLDTSSIVGITMGSLIAVAMIAGVIYCDIKNEKGCIRGIWGKCKTCGKLKKVAPKKPAPKKAAPKVTVIKPKEEPNVDQGPNWDVWGFSA